jgi:hypothetical protein
MEYTILVQKAGGLFGTDFAQAAQLLAATVNEAILNGWEPQGGLAIGQTSGTETPYLMQAMVRYSDEDLQDDLLDEPLP